jgi:hypothetical protein
MTRARELADKFKSCAVQPAGAINSRWRQHYADLGESLMAELGVDSIAEALCLMRPTVQSESFKNLREQLF